MLVELLYKLLTIKQMLTVVMAIVVGGRARRVRPSALVHLKHTHCLLHVSYIKEMIDVNLGNKCI